MVKNRLTGFKDWKSKKKAKKERATTKYGLMWKEEDQEG